MKVKTLETTWRNRKRRIDLEVIRIIAILLVFINHAAANSVISNDMYSSGMIVYTMYLVLAAFARVAVPLFFMVSGVLLIPKEESLKDLLRKRVLKYVLIIIGFSLFSYAYLVHLGIRTFSKDSFLECLIQMYTDSVVIPYWFLYSYLGFLLLLPFVRIMVKNMETKHFSYLIVLHLIFSAALQVVEYFTGLARINISLPIACETSLFYVILGYFIDNNGDIITQKFKKLLGVLAVVSVACSTGMVYWQISKGNHFTNADAYKFSSALIVFPTAAVFLLCKVFNKIKNAKLEKILQWIGGTTFGAYLLETVFKQVTYDIYFLAQKFVPPYIAWVMWVGSAFVLAVLAVSVYKGCVIGIKKITSKK